MRLLKQIKLKITHPLLYVKFFQGMLITHLLPFYFILHLISASNVFEEGMIEMKTFKKINEVKKPIQNANQPNSFEPLSDDIIQIILGFLIDTTDDYIFYKGISKSFRRNYDTFAYNVFLRNFPDCIKEITARWGHESLKYQLIPAANLIHSYGKPVRTQNENLYYNALQMIQSFRGNILNINERFRLINALLKLKIVTWMDVSHLMIIDRKHDYKISWQYGLTSIAREVDWIDPAYFYTSIVRNRGILIPIAKRHYSLSKFMIETCFFYGRWFVIVNKLLVDDILKGLVKAEYWDLVRQIYEVDTHYFSPENLVGFAEQGNILALRELRDIVERFPGLFAHHAALNGHLPFLKEMFDMKLLKKSIFADLKKIGPAFDGAISSGSVECLDFLVERLGKKYFREANKEGYMPIHKAATSDEPEILRAIIRYYPYYKEKFSMTPTVSPLHLALSRGKFENAMILLDQFPELINFIDERKANIFHICAENCYPIPEVFLDLAHPNIISSRNICGETALHLAALTMNHDSVTRLMRTGLFTGLERNKIGVTAVFYYERHNHNSYTQSTTVDLMNIFNLQSEAQVIEALEIIETN